MWYAFPIGVGVGVLLEGQSVKRSITLGVVSSGVAFAISRGALPSLWFATQAVGGITLGQAAGAYVGGALVGTAISGLLFGEEGARDAIEFYGNPVSAPKKLASSLSKAPGRIAASIASSRAVENNAAGLPTGWNANVAPGLQNQSDWALENLRRNFPNA